VKVYVGIKEQFDGIDHLTQGEAGHLRQAPSVDAIRDRIATARHEAVSRVGASRTAPPTRTSQLIQCGRKVQYRQ